MEVSATAKYIRVQPRKVRIIADEVRGKNAGHAAALLHHHTSKGARSLRKVLINAMANAAENHGLAPETLKIATIMIDEGPRLKRMTAKAMGRGARILKKTSHITVVVEDVEPTPVVKPHGTKAKPRPTFAAKPARGGSRPASATPTTAPVTEPADSPSTLVPEPTPIAEPEPTPGVADARATETAATQDGAADAPVEATPVTVSDAPEEAGTAGPAATHEEPEPTDAPATPSHDEAAPVVPGTAEASPVTAHDAPEESGGAAPKGTNDGESSPEAKGAVENEEHNA